MPVPEEVFVEELDEGVDGGGVVEVSVGVDEVPPVPDDVESVDDVEELAGGAVVVVVVVVSEPVPEEFDGGADVSSASTGRAIRRSAKNPAARSGASRDVPPFL